MKFLKAIALLFLLQGCLQKDGVVLPPQTHDMAFFHSLSLPQVFLDIDNKLVTQTNTDSTWHLKFQNGDNDWAIFLNPMRDISVHRTEFTDMGDLEPSYIVQHEVSWERDVQVGGNVLPAIGTWGDYSFTFPKSFNSVYILRIKNHLGVVYLKMQILSANYFNYTIQYCDLNGENPYYFVVPKNKETTHSYLNIRPYPRLVTMEPSQKAWQLQFSFGIDSIVNNLDQQPLKIFGLLGLYQKLQTNKQDVEVAVETDLVYDEIDYFSAKHMTFIRVEQMKVPFIYFDNQDQQVKIRPKVSLVCRFGERYVKLAPLRYEELQAGVFTVKMQLQNL